tara:strand:- start:206 stop:451 length:246 start_codon:yes stop_codon:yes gene_type:complete
MSNIINVNLKGGLGNQLFQIAYALKIKKLFGGNIIMNSSFAWWPLYFAELEKSSLVIRPKVLYKKGEYPNHPLHNLSTHLL